MTEPTWQTADGSVRIYALICPQTGRVRYVGKTNKSIGRRVIEHVNVAKRKRRLRVHHWINKVGKPLAVQLQEVPSGGNWQGAESRWIRRFRRHGCDLCNHTDGGEGLAGHRFTVEHRRKIAAALCTGMDFFCEVCGATFWRKLRDIKKGNCRFCSRSCYFTWQRGKPKQMPPRNRDKDGRYVS